MKRPFLFTLSPAKRFHTLDRVCVQATHTHFTHIADEIVAQLQLLNAAQLKSMMSISDSIAQLNVERFKNYQFKSPHSGFPAALLFAGDAYRSLDFASLSEDDMLYAQQCLLILSGLYGLLRPLDAIQPYRLEMGCNTRERLGKSLYEAWRTPLSEHLNRIITHHRFEYHLNLSSSEYGKALDTHALSIPTIDMVFAQPHLESYKVVGIKAKKARGAMTRYLITNRPQTLSALKDFDQGYRFSPEHSSQHRFVYLER